MSRVSTRTLALASSIAALSMTLSACSLLGGNTSAFNVEVGQCVQNAESEKISDLQVIDCAKPHQAEIFYTVELSAKQRIPEEDLSDYARDTCIDAFEDYVGRSYEESELDTTELYPSEESWATGERTIACFAISAAGPTLVGSVKDSKK